jgi:hypothetical protein
MSRKSLGHYSLGDDSVIAFTPFGIENLKERTEMDQDHTH